MATRVDVQQDGVVHDVLSTLMSVLPTHARTVLYVTMVSIVSHVLVPVDILEVFVI